MLPTKANILLAHTKSINVENYPSFSKLCSYLHKKTPTSKYYPQNNILKWRTLMNTKKIETRSALPYAALDDVPTPNSDAKEIVGLVKSSGKISGYQLSDGTTVTKEEGVSMAKAGDIKGVGIAHRKDSEYLKSLPDGTEGNNLSNLPSITASEADSNTQG